MKMYQYSIQTIDTSIRKRNKKILPILQTILQN
jgi:hypothetical protein